MPTDAQNRILSQLLSDIADGDTAAFARLYRLSNAKLYAIALRILKKESLAQDCLQETYLSVWRQAASYQPGRAAPRTWLSVITRNRALDMLRRRKHDLLSESVELEELIAPAGADPIDNMALERCLQQLGKEQAACVKLAYYEGLTHPELATRLGIPLGTVKTWIRRGLETLRKCLEA